MRPAVGRALVLFRTPLQVGLDLAAWVVGLGSALVFRYDLSVDVLKSSGLLTMIECALALQVALGLLLQLYRGRYRYGSFEEVLALFVTVAVTTGCLFFANLRLFEVRPVPGSIPVAGGIAALVLTAGSRYVWRLVVERGARPRHAEQRLLVYGAGEGGHEVVTSLLRAGRSDFVPVALLDDDPRKQNLRIRGVRVFGGRRDLARARQRYDAHTLLIAIPSADALLVRELSALADSAGLKVKVLPTVDDLLGGTVSVDDIRDINIADLLGRRQIETDLDAIAGYLTGRRVLVTGAGGSIGAELCRQIHRYGPAELIMLDRDESALHSVQLAIHGKAMLDGEDTVLADIRDVEHLIDIFQARRPDVVFHAAALKHLPLLERFPGEAVKSNVWGTLTVLEAAKATGVSRFVNISTDKAADPISVLGYSKRIAERLTAEVAASAEGTYLSVRFGNVLGSRGSVLTAFQSQIEGGGPVTVTDPGVTRYFMTVQEAVQLVIQAGAIGRAGEVLVLDMGQPVRINDVAKALVEKAPRNVEIVYTGLREGEKMHEDLFGSGETDTRPVHPLVSHVDVPALAVLVVRELDPWQPREAVIANLAALCDGDELPDLLCELDDELLRSDRRP